MARETWRGQQRERETRSKAKRLPLTRRPSAVRRPTSSRKPPPPTRRSHSSTRARARACINKSIHRRTTDTLRPPPRPLLQSLLLQLSLLQSKPKLGGRGPEKKNRQRHAPMSVLAAAQAQLALVKGDDGEIMTQQFLSVCKLVFPVIGEVGGGWTRCAHALVRGRLFVLVGRSVGGRPTAQRLPPFLKIKQTNSARHLGSSRWTLEATST